MVFGRLEAPDLFADAAQSCLHGDTFSLALKCLGNLEFDCHGGVGEMVIHSSTKGIAFEPLESAVKVVEAKGLLLHIAFSNVSFNFIKNPHVLIPAVTKEKGTADGGSCLRFE